MSQLLSQDFEAAKEVFLQTRREIIKEMVREDLQAKTIQFLTKTHHLAHVLYFYLGFQAQEIAAQIKTNLATVLKLINNKEIDSESGLFERMAYFYCSCAQYKILPSSCSVN